MERNITFINWVILLSFLFVLWQGIQIIFMSGATEKTKATIVETRFANSNGTTFRNSNWALVSYNVENKEFISEHRIQVSMNSKVGDVIEVKYYKNAPERLAAFSLKKFIIGLVVMFIFIIVRVLFLKGILH